LKEASLRRFRVFASSISSARFTGGQGRKYRGAREKTAGVPGAKGGFYRDCGEQITGSGGRKLPGSRGDFDPR